MYEHFSKVFNGTQDERIKRQENDEAEQMEDWEEDNRVTTAEPTKEEIKITPKAQRVGGAPGLNNIPPPKKS